MLGLVLGTLRLPLIVAISGNPLAAAGTNIAISAASAAQGRCATPATGGSTGASSRGWRRRRSSARSRGRSSPTMFRSAALCGDRGRARLERHRSRRPARPRGGPGAAPSLAGRRSGLGIGALGGAVGVILGTLRMPALAAGRRPGREARRWHQPRRRLPARWRGLRGAGRRGGRRVGDLSAGLAGAIPGGWLGAKATGRFDETGSAARARRRARGRRRRLRGAGRRLEASDGGDGLGQLRRRACCAGVPARRRRGARERASCGLACDRDQRGATGRPSAGRRRSRVRGRRRRRRRRRRCVQAEAVSANV